LLVGAPACGLLLMCLLLLSSGTGAVDHFRRAACCWFSGSLSFAGSPCACTSAPSLRALETFALNMVLIMIIPSSQERQK
jgi:hypothetical protein